TTSTSDPNGNASDNVSNIVANDHDGPRVGTTTLTRPDTTAHLSVSSIVLRGVVGPGGTEAWGPP
ncbi:MAG: hypothetical protein RLZZ272_1775, partial [Actinomycetota bacterium]